VLICFPALLNDKKLNAEFVFSREIIVFAI
jgi:hypothetical protein